MTLLTNTLTFNFARAVTWVKDTQVPQELEICVIPLANPSVPGQATFVGGLQSQSIVLADTTNTVVFRLVPTFAPGLTEPVQYRVEWRQGGITGQTVSYDFAMPAQDVTWDHLVDLNNVIDGEVYVQQTQVGVASGVAALDPHGNVVDSSGTPVATSLALAAVQAALDLEVANRNSAIVASQASMTASQASASNTVLGTVAGNLASAVATLNASISSVSSGASTATATERTRALAAEAALSSSLSTLSGTVAGHTTTIAAKADLVGGYLKSTQIPPSLIRQAFTAADQTAMLGLSSATLGDLAIRPDGIFTLSGSPYSSLSSWTKVTRVNTVNAKSGDVTLTASDVGAMAATPADASIAQSKITGLTGALTGKAAASDLTTLTSTVTGIVNDTSIVRTDASGTFSGKINTAKLGSDVPVIRTVGGVLQVQHPTTGAVIASGTGTVYSVNGKSGTDFGGNITLTAADVSAIAVGGSIAQSQVTGLSTSLSLKLDANHASVTNSRTPTSHASTHASGGSDPITVAQSQVTGLATSLGLLASASTVSTQAAQITALQNSVTILLGGVTPQSNPIKAVWFDGTAAFTGVINPAAFQTAYAVQQKSAFGKASNGTYYYDPAGAASGEWVYPYITPNGHLQLRVWNEANAPDPAYALQSDLAALQAAAATQASLAALTTTVGAKANQSDLAAVQAALPSLASVASVNSLTTALGAKASQVDLNATNVAVAAKASQADVTTLSSTVAGLATQASVTTLSGTVSSLSTAVAGKVTKDAGGLVPLASLPSIPFSQIVNTVGGSNLTTVLGGYATLTGGVLTASQIPTTIPQSSISGLSTTLAGYAPLVGGQVPSSYLPNLTTSHVFTATSQTDMQSKSTAVVGDICVITTGSAAGSYILGSTPASTLSNWIALPPPGNTVTSVNGIQGPTVNLTATNVGAIASGATIPATQISTTGGVLQTVINGLVKTTDLAASNYQSLSQLQAFSQASGTEKQQAQYVAIGQVSSLSAQPTIDGTTLPLLTNGQPTVVLLTGQSGNPVQNGPWQISGGAWSRPTDFLTGNYFTRGSMITVANGTATYPANANTFWQLTSASGTIGTDANYWTKVMTAGASSTYGAGNGISFAANPNGGGGTFSLGLVTSGTALATGASQSGLAVGPGGLMIDTAVVARKYSTVLPASGTIATVTHGLNTTNIGGVFIQPYPYGAQVLACPTVTGPNTLTIEFASGVTTNQWVVTVIG